MLRKSTKIKKSINTVKEETTNLENTKIKKSINTVKEETTNLENTKIKKSINIVKEETANLEKNEIDTQLIQSEPSDNDSDTEMSSQIDVLAKNISGKFYEEVPEAKNIVSTLVDNILLDDSYQDYLKDLAVSDAKGSSKKLENIKKTFATIKVFNSTTEPLFLSKDIGIIIGASNIKTMIKNYNSTEKVSGIVILNGKSYTAEFLTRHGIYRLLLTNRTKLSEVFRGFIYKLLDHMYYNEFEKLNKIIKEFTTENKELVKEASDELSGGIENYTHIHALEMQQYVERINDNIYMIEKLEAEKQTILKRFKNYRSDLDNDESVQMNRILKNKYLKEITIWLVNPATLDKLFRGVKSPYSFAPEKLFLEDYGANFDFLVKSIASGSKTHDDVLFYLNITYNPNKEDIESLKQKALTFGTEIQTDTLTVKKEQFPDDYPIAYDHVFDKNSLTTIVDILKNECEHYQISKTKKSPNNFIFKTSIEHIKSVTERIILESDPLPKDKSKKDEIWDTYDNTLVKFTNY
ncbi:MAG: hypothetical protein ACRCZI_02840 [Cetobacterium sp.]